MVGDEEGTTFGGDLLQSFPLDPEPVAVHRVVETAHDRAHVLASAPLIDVGTPGFVDQLLDFGLVASGRHRKVGDGGTGQVRGCGDLLGLVSLPLSLCRRMSDDGIDEFAVSRAPGWSGCPYGLHGVVAHRGIVPCRCRCRAYQCRA